MSRPAADAAAASSAQVMQLGIAGGAFCDGTLISTCRTPCRLVLDRLSRPDCPLLTGDRIDPTSSPALNTSSKTIEIQMSGVDREHHDLESDS